MGVTLEAINEQLAAIMQQVEHLELQEGEKATLILPFPPRHPENVEISCIGNKAQITITGSAK